MNRFLSWFQIPGAWLLLSVPFTLLGQGTWSLKQVLVANSNQWGEPVTIGSLNPVDSIYQVFGEIQTEAVQAMIAHQGRLYVAATDSLVVFDLETYQKLQAVNVPGINKLALAGNTLVVGRWYGASSGFVWLLDRDDLHLIAELNVSNETSGILIYGSRAFIGIPGPYGTPAGKVGVVDLLTDSLVAEIPLDTAGKGIAALVEKDGLVYAISTGDYGAPSGVISALDPNSFQVMNHVIIQPGLAWNPLIGMANGSLIVNASSGIAHLTLPILTPGYSIQIPGSYSTGIVDSISQNFFLTETDYFSYGVLRLFDAAGTLAGSYPVGVGCEAVCGDYRFLPGPPPFVAQPLPDVWWDEAWSRFALPLDGVVVDPGGGPVQYQVVSNSQPQALHALVQGDSLVLTRITMNPSPVQIILGGQVGSVQVVDSFQVFFAGPQGMSPFPEGPLELSMDGGRFELQGPDLPGCRLSVFTINGSLVQDATITSNPWSVRLKGRPAGPVLVRLIHPVKGPRFRKIMWCQP